MGSHSESYTLSECTPSEIPDMIEVYYAAFSPDPFGAYTFNAERCGLEEMNRWLTDRFINVMKKPETRTFCVRDGAGTMAAFLRCTFPHKVTEEMKAENERKKAEQKKKELDGTDDTWPRGANLEVCYAKFGQLAEKLEKYVDHENTYVAHLLGTHPDHQRRGLASMLLRHIFQLADKENRQMYIEATDAGFPVYQKLGFVQVDEVVVDVSKFGGKELKRNRCMLRQPVSVETEVRQVDKGVREEQNGVVVDIDVEEVC